MGIGYRDIAGEPVGVVGESLADTSGLASMAGSIFNKRRKKHRKSSKRSNRHHGSQSRKRRRKSTRSSKRGRTRSRRGTIKYTKNGQPYKIMPNGKARFLKKR